MDLGDVTPDKFFKKFTFSSDQTPEDKIVMSNGAFAQCAIFLLIAKQLKRLADNG